MSLKGNPLLVETNSGKTNQNKFFAKQKLKISYFMWYTGDIYTHI